MEQFPNIDRVMAETKASNWKQAFRLIAAQAAQDTGLSEENIAARLVEDEHRAPSAIGRGVALPHLTFSGLRRPYRLFMVFEKPIAMAALDGRPVDLLLLLLSPEGATAAERALHLRRLYRASRFLANTELCDKLRGAGTPDAVTALLRFPEERLLAA